MSLSRRLPCGLLFLFCLTELVNGFSIRHSNNARLQAISKPSRLYLSLEDSWEEAVRSIPSSSSVIDVERITRQLADTRWTTPLSPEWFADVGKALQDTQELYLQLPLWVEVGIVAAPVVTALSAVLYQLSMPPMDYRTNKEPYARGNYDPVAARAYYSKQPKLVAQRCLQLLRLGNKFLINFLLDKYVWKREERMRVVRADELLQLITNLGPTAIKIGQALSVRPDLIPTEYASALATLQDQVPPFDGLAAKEILLRELGPTVYAQLKGMGLETTNKLPIASASIGQVYKASLADGREVAVKVQRPNVLAEIALDLHIVREFAPIYQKLTSTNSDLQALANEWGRGFIAELDYIKEANNTIRFNQGMQRRNMNAVCAPTVLLGYSTEQILTTEWVEGTRIDRSNAEDIPRLCSVALNAYLVMLLDSDFSLHCDPHPGNLLRTTDGRLCILDHGMTLDIDPNLQYSLLDFVAHLTSNNYDALPEDLVALNFLNPDKLDFIRRSGALEPFKYVLKQAGQGGGAKGVRDRIFQDYREKYGLDATEDELRVEMRKEMKQQMADIVERESVATGITLEVEELQRRNRDSFRIPEWFLYTSRAFLTLEGVSLQADPDYSIIKSCFPYIAKRLVADNDPRARKALRDLIYGASDAVDVDRLSDLASGFSSYTTSTKTINAQVAGPPNGIVSTRERPRTASSDRMRKKSMVDTAAAITLAKDSADIILAPDGNLIQNLLVEEGALATSAQVKDAVRRTMVDGPRHFRESLPFGVGTYLPQLLFESQLGSMLRKTPQEIQAQKLTEKILAISASRSPKQSGKLSFSSPAPGDRDPRSVLVDSLRELDAEEAALVLKELRENLAVYTPLMGRLGGKFASTLLRTASYNIETTLDELSRADETPSDRLFTSVAKSLSTAAERGASALFPTS